MALVGAGAAAHADVHEQPEGAEFVEALLHPLEDDLLPVRRQLPVGVERLPLARVRHVEVLEALGPRAVAEGPLPELHVRIEPVLRPRPVVDLDQRFRAGRLVGHVVTPCRAGGRPP